MIKKFFSVMILFAMIFAGQNVFARSQLTYQAHVQDRGWMRPVSEGQVAGTTGQDRRLEAIIINFPDGIEYNVHVQDIGWQGWRRAQSAKIVASRQSVFDLRAVSRTNTTFTIGRTSRISAGKIGLKMEKLPVPKAKD